MKKPELIQQVSEQTGLPKGQVRKVLDSAFAIMSQEISNGTAVIIPDVGRLVPKDRPASTKTNPETGETIQVPAKKIVAFRPAKPIQEKLAAQ
jgi:DNA-binding protein HU-beta